jgi:hypothetical protein
MTTHTIRDPHHVATVSFVLTDYYPEWRDFESWCGTMADDECAHGHTPAERIADPSVCACGGSPQLSAD